ncbi:hypothetical protein L5515_018646 [Caenorhabditis briggsae]|uniref:NTF2-like domain-containing protein n=1 Tax=Caenorhabditis briggsae TaxID=6238 RepID=A0AAE9FMN9_CAEBR|nr:hypothetical protein L5515_018646 [Caenorhabditis briggsae]
MSPSILVLCLLAGTSWTFVPDDPEFRGIPSIGYPNDVFYFTQNAFVTSSDSAEKIARKFLARMTHVLQSRNVATISELFMPEFEFWECGHFIEKEQFVGMLSTMPADFSFTLKSAYNAGEPFGTMYGFTIIAPGISSFSTEVEFSLYQREQKLFFGQPGKCQQKQDIMRFSQPEDSNAVVSRLDEPSSDTAQQIAEKFLGRMTRALQSRNVAEISALFTPTFIFKNCKDEYNKQQFVGMLSTMPARFLFTLKSAHFVGEVYSIEFVVIVKGFSASPIEAKFYLDESEQQSDFVDVFCPLKQFGFVRFSQPKDSNAVVLRFLDSMKQIMASRKAALIGELFDYGFFHKGCHATYSKAQTVAMITALPSNAPIDFSLVDSKWINQGQIEYTVYVTVPIMESFKAHFVYCPQRNVLKSGSVNGCPIKGFTVFY